MQERCTGYSKNRGDIEKTTIFPDEKAETHQSGGVHNVFQRSMKFEFPIVV